MADLPEVGAALTARNSALAPFWFTPPGLRKRALPGLAGLRIFIVDAEDAFTAMLDQQLRALGLSVTVASYRAFTTPGAVVPGTDLAVIGPGPGDPRDLSDLRISTLYALTRDLIARGAPFMSICLGHQVLSGIVGLPMIRLDAPRQGTQQAIDFFGRTETVGFYNTFAAHSPVGLLPAAGQRGPVEVSRDHRTGRVHGLRGRRFISMQFHPESLLSPHGSALLARHLTALAGTGTTVSVR
jgi:phenazine biosynthesis protein phzE